MDFTNYPNISRKVNELGGVKSTIFNKHLLIEAEASWQQLSPEELQQLDKEIPDAKVFFSALFTPTAVCVYDCHSFKVIRVQDILWFYGNIIKQNINFIPVGKILKLWTVTRNGQFHELGNISKPFTKSSYIADTLGEIEELLNPYRKGIAYGWSSELNQLFTRDLQKGIEIVDSNGWGKAN